MFNRTLLLIVALPVCLIIISGRANAQEHEVPKVEVGGHFTSPQLRDLGYVSVDTFTLSPAGVGGRVTYNATDFFGLEAEVNFFPEQVASTSTTQAQFGVKVGKRFRKFGLFAKVRPGFLSMDTSTLVSSTTEILSDGRPFVTPNFEFGRRTFFTTDVGGVAEFYPSRKLLVRVDVGDTLIAYHGHEVDSGYGFSFRDQPPGVVHNLQVTTSVAYRFLNPKGADETDPPAPSGGNTPRYEVGVQFTSLLLNRTTQLFGLFSFEGAYKLNTPAVGGRFTFNLNDRLALEGAVDFMTRSPLFFRSPLLSGSTYGTHGVQGQFGIKAGHRFERVGVFGKARPGFLRYGDVTRVIGMRAETQFFPGETVLIGIFGPGPKTYFETDVGGVVEFYPSRRLVTRFDLGDTIIWYRGRVAQANSLRRSIFHQPDETRHNFQFSVGVGFRF